MMPGERWPPGVAGTVPGNALPGGGLPGDGTVSDASGPSGTGADGTGPSGTGPSGTGPGDPGTEPMPRYGAGLADPSVDPAAETSRR